MNPNTQTRHVLYEKRNITIAINNVMWNMFNYDEIEKTSKFIEYKSDGKILLTAPK
jgi:hypothetical protein